MIAGVRIGHDTDLARATGCTVLLPPAGAICAAEVRGGAPGSRELALLEPAGNVEHADAILLTGGSAFGLAAADGIVQELAAVGVGHPTPAGPVPIVCGAVIFDLMLVAPAHPDADGGRRALAAALAAAPDDPVERGTVGAGTGASVGTMDGLAGATKGGVGIGVCRLPDGVSVAALAVVNALGDVVGEDGGVLAGLWRDGAPAATSAALLRDPAPAPPLGTATTLVVIATDAALDKRQTWLLARAAHAGIAHATRPAATAYDGDTAFAIATGVHEAPRLLVLQSATATATAAAIRDGVRSATGLGGVPAAGER